MPMSASLCALTVPAAGNWAGLIGAGLLAYGALRALPVAARMYRVTSDLTALVEARRRASEGAVGDDLARRVAEQDQAWEKMLADAAATLGAQRDRWSGWDTAATVAGLVLTLASDGLPLAAAWCPSAPTAVTVPAVGPASGAR